MTEETITNFDPNRKRKPLPPIPDVAPPNSQWQDLPPAQLASDLVQGRLVPFQSDAPKIADKLANEYLVLLQRFNQVKMQLDTVLYVLDRVGNNPARVDGGMEQ